MKNSTMSQQANGLTATEGMPMADLAAIESASADVIRSRILTVRGVQVMLDRDLAALYGVPTKALNQAVKRNIERFPEEFMFAVSGEEMCELVTNCDRFKNMKHSSVPMRAFTEHGIIMLAPLIRTAVWRNSSEHIHCPFPVRRESVVYYFHATTEWNGEVGKISRENKTRGRRGVRRCAGERGGGRGSELPRARRCADGARAGVPLDRGGGIRRLRELAGRHAVHAQDGQRVPDLSGREQPG